MTASPTLLQALAGAIDGKLAGVRVSLPARVTSYDAGTCKVSAQPLIRDAYIDEDGERATELPPIVNEVPVMFPGSGGVRFKFPIAVGDTVLLVFASSSLDRWLVRGGEVDPVHDHHHTLTDAVAIPGLQDFAHVTDASPMIEITANEIRAGGSSALATKADLDTLKSAISGAATVPTDGGAAFKAAILVALAAWPVGTIVLKGS
jgi:hypothetical protein